VDECVTCASTLDALKLIASADFASANFLSKLKIKSPLCQQNETHADRWRNEFQIENVVRMC
jgi:hypothetical protein